MRKLTGLMMAVTFAGQLLGQLPAARSGSQRVTWRVRTLVGDQRLLQWRIAPAADAFPNLTFTESVDQANGLGAPAQNIVAGDSSGRIGWSIFGAIPRRVGTEGNRPATWTEASIGWNGWPTTRDAVSPGTSR